MIGHKIAQVLESKNNIIGTSRKRIEPINIGLKNSKIIFKNFTVDTDFNFLNNLMPDIIINCVGITTRRINNTNMSQLEFFISKLPHILGDWVINNMRRLIHLSTDCVFSGKTGNYTDNSFHDATDLYGKSKSLGEVNNKNTLTIRTSLIGREIFNFTELFEWFHSNNGGKVSGYDNVIYSGITTIRLGKLLEVIINDFPNLSGIYNISSDVEVICDIKALSQVIDNLIENSVKYGVSEECNEIIINMKDQGSKVRFEIEDRGQGIPADQRERVFERFFRIQNNNTSVKEGTGLGLSIVKNLVNLMGGSVGNEKAYPAGTIFWFTLNKKN